MAGERQSPQAIPPHLMFYAPYATDKDIGSPPRPGTCHVSSGRDSRMRTSLSFLGPLSTRAISCPFEAVERPASFFYAQSFQPTTDWKMERSKAAVAWQ